MKVERAWEVTNILNSEGITTVKLFDATIYYRHGHPYGALVDGTYWFDRRTDLEATASTADIQLAGANFPARSQVRDGAKFYHTVTKRNYTYEDKSGKWKPS